MSESSGKQPMEDTTVPKKSIPASRDEADTTTAPEVTMTASATDEKKKQRNKNKSVGQNRNQALAQKQPSKADEVAQTQSRIEETEQELFTAQQRLASAIAENERLMSTHETIIRETDDLKNQLAEQQDDFGTWRLGSLAEMARERQTNSELSEKLDAALSEAHKLVKEKEELTRAATARDTELRSTTAKYESLKSCEGFNEETNRHLTEELRTAQVELGETRMKLRRKDAELENERSARLQEMKDAQRVNGQYEELKKRHAALESQMEDELLSDAYHRSKLNGALGLFELDMIIPDPPIHTWSDTTEGRATTPSPQSSWISSTNVGGLMSSLKSEISEAIHRTRGSQTRHGSRIRRLSPTREEEEQEQEEQEEREGGLDEKHESETVVGEEKGARNRSSKSPIAGLERVMAGSRKPLGSLRESAERRRQEPMNWLRVPDASSDSEEEFPKRTRQAETQGGLAEGMGWIPPNIASPEGQPEPIWTNSPESGRSDEFPVRISQAGTEENLDEGYRWVSPDFVVRQEGPSLQVRNGAGSGDGDESPVRVPQAGASEDLDEGYRWMSPAGVAPQGQPGSRVSNGRAPEGSHQRSEPSVSNGRSPEGSHQQPEPSVSNGPAPEGSHQPPAPIPQAGQEAENLDEGYRWVTPLGVIPQQQEDAVLNSVINILGVTMLVVLISITVGIFAYLIGYLKGYQKTGGCLSGQPTTIPVVDSMSNQPAEPIGTLVDHPGNMPFVVHVPHWVWRGIVRYTPEWARKINYDLTKWGDGMYWWPIFHSDYRF